MTNQSISTGSSGDVSAPTRRRAFAWEPGVDTAWAGAAVLAFWACYYLGTRPGMSGVLTLGILLLGTALPAWVVFKVLGEGWEAFGITRRRLVLSLAVSAFLGLGSLSGLIRQAPAGMDLASHVVANVLVFWEPFFVFGFLFMRWEKAFGFVAAPFLVAFGFFLQHIGAVPLEVAASFGGFGLFFGIVFALTRNLFILWPLFYGVASAIGTVQSGYAFTWSEAAWGAVTLLAQVIILGVAARAWRQPYGEARA